LTVLSAVVSDPLYIWSVSTIKARQCQRNDGPTQEGDEVDDYDTTAKKVSAVNPFLSILSENKNDAATRTIARINAKLKGYEEGTLGERQTVEGQVRLLINAATDPDNLCKLFTGWGAWV